MFHPLECVIWDILKLVFYVLVFHGRCKMFFYHQCYFLFHLFLIQLKECSFSATVTLVNKPRTFLQNSFYENYAA